MNRLSLPLSLHQRFAVVATVAVVAGIVAGFSVLGTPARQRLISADRQRLQTLSSIAQSLHWQAEGKGSDYALPEQLALDQLGQDPLTQLPYEYHRRSERTYQLCAEFDTDSSTYALQNQATDPAIRFWNHPQGRHCFEFDLTQQPPSFY